MDILKDKSVQYLFPLFVNRFYFSKQLALYLSLKKVKNAYFFSLLQELSQISNIDYGRMLSLTEYA